MAERERRAERLKARGLGESQRDVSAPRDYDSILEVYVGIDNNCDGRIDEACIK